MNRFCRVSLICFGSLLLCFSALLLGAAAMAGGVSLDTSKLVSAHADIEIYDGEDNLVEEVSLLNGCEKAKIEDLPVYTKNAFIAIEDKRFYSHHGLDWKRIAGASWQNLKSGTFKEGASTISQQLIKNTHLSGEKTIRRKLKEMKLTLQLEKRYTKDCILEMYLNSIYFGYSNFGIKDAAYFYFAEEPSALTVSQSAMLAGMIQSPNHYSPFFAPEKCRTRRDLVIEKMFEQGYITAKEREEALRETLPVTKNHLVKKPYLEEVWHEAEDVLGKDCFYADLKIYTFLDADLQGKIEKLKDEYNTDKTFLVADNEAHGIKAFYTSLSGKVKRLPGSTLKPLLVYAPAMEENLLSPATPLKDEKTDFGGYAPSNYNGTCRGYVSAREALSDSLNIPAVSVFNDLGIDKGCGYLEKMRLHVGEEDKSLALALGGMKEGYSLKDLTSAYGVFTNEGNYTPLTLIREIKKDTVSLYRKPQDKQKVFSFETVSLINDMLKSAAKSGTAKKLADLPFEVCAKTGTSGTQEKNIDAYTIGYTSADTVAVWLGNDDNSEIGTTGGGMACAINKKIMEYLYNYSIPKSMKKSPNIQTICLDKKEYQNNHRLVIADDNAPKKETFEELFISSRVPKEKSDQYSFPRLTVTPKITFADNTISIVLCETNYSKYCIIRKDDLGRIKRFEAEGSTFLDGDIEDGRIYTYSVAPYYKGNKGKETVLPSVKTKITGEKSRDTKSNSPLIEKEWWNE